MDYRFGRCAAMVHDRLERANKLFWVLSAEDIPPKADSRCARRHNIRCKLEHLFKRDRGTASRYYWCGTTCVNDSLERLRIPGIFCFNNFSAQIRCNAR